MNKATKRILAAVLAVIVAVLSVVTVFAGEYDPVQNRYYSYSEKGDCTVDYGDVVWVSSDCIMTHRFTVNGRLATCTWSSNETPDKGTYKNITKYYLNNDSARAKAFYWLYLDHDAKISSASAKYDRSSVTYLDDINNALDDAGATGVYAFVHSVLDYMQQGELNLYCDDAWNNVVDRFEDKITNYPNVPKEYRIFYIYPQGNAAQSLMSWEETPHGYIKVIKSSSNTSITNGNSAYSFKDIEYYVSKSKTDFDTGSNNYLGAIKLNANGEGHSKDGSRETLRFLSPGEYYVKEGYTPSGCGYEKDNTVYTVNVTKNHTSGSPYVLRVSDTPKTAYCKIIKSSTQSDLTSGNSNYSFEGIRYSFSKSKTDFLSSGSNYIGYIELDKNGVGYSANGSRATLRNLVPGTYYVKEDYVPSDSGYIKSDTVHKITVTLDHTVNAPLVLRVSDTPITTCCKIVKSSTKPDLTTNNSNYTFEGIRYSFSKSKTDFSASGSNYIGYVELDKNGVGYTTNGSRETLRNLVPGTYYVKESYIPSDCGYIKSDTVLKITVTLDHTAKAPLILRVSDTPITACCKIVKSSTNPDLTSNNTNYSFEGIRYSFSKSKTDFSASGSNYIGYVELDKNGVGYTTNGSRETLRNLVPGTYYVKEDYVPDDSGYEKNNTVYTITVTKSHTVTAPLVVRVSDTPKTVCCKIIKSSTRPDLTENNSNYSFEGIQYSFSKSNTDFSPSGTNYIGFVTLNKDGVGYTTDGSRATLRNLVPGTYYVKENYVPDDCSYEKNNTVYKITVTMDHTTTAPLVLRVSDTPKTVYGKVVKASARPDITNNNPDYSFEGIRYSFSKSNTDFSASGSNYIGFVELDSNGVGYTADGSRDTLRNLVPGTYYVKETYVPSGCKYKLDKTVYKMTFTFSNDENNLKVLNVKDEPEGTFSAKIIKISSLPEISDNNTEYSFEGAEFTVYKTRTDANQKINPFKTVTTDENGVSSVSDIEPGTYYFRETKAPFGFELSNEIKEMKIEISQNETYEVKFEDKPIMAPISILLKKVTANGSQQYDLSGAEYTVCYYNGQFDSTDDLAGVSPTRTWVFATDSGGNIAYNDDYLMSGDDLFYDSISDAYGLPLGTVTIQESNAPQGYYLDEQVYLSQITVNGTTNVVSYNNPVSEEQSIPQVSFSGTKTWDDDNDRDGKRPTSVTVELYRDNELIDSFEMNDDNGWQYSFLNLEKGYIDITLENQFHEYLYEIRENDVENYTTESTGLVQDSADSDHYTCDFINHYTPEKISVNGTKTWIDFDDAMGYRPESIKVILYRDGIKADEVVTSQNENWTYSFSDLHKYHDGGVAYQYSIEEEDISGYTVKVDGYNLKNTLETGSVTLCKTDEGGNPLEGVTFALFTENGNLVSYVTNGDTYRFWSLTENENEAEYMTSADGTIFIEDLPCGKYYFEETKTLLGFIPYGEKMWFEISADSDSTKDIVVEAENARLIMPETGGSGTNCIYIISIILAAFAGAMYCISKSKTIKRKKVH